MLSSKNIHLQFRAQEVQKSAPEYRLVLWLADDEGSRRAYVHDIVFAQLPSEDAGAKGSVSANISAAKEDDERDFHSGAAPRRLWKSSPQNLTP